MIFFLARLAPPAGFEVFTDFRQLIEASGGQEPVKAICHKLEFSLRQADRLFAQCLGFSPKTYARITRFQRALAQLMKDSELSLVQLAAACGYYDQS
ncbi:MAG: AraC family transcriptional regulator, partial [Candidatus Melainabacteria bacterium HGW-Melainabacteria-1]